MDFVNMDHDIYKLYRINAEFDPSEIMIILLRILKFELSRLILSKEKIMRLVQKD